MLGIPSLGVMDVHVIGKSCFIMMLYTWRVKSHVAMAIHSILTVKITVVVLQNQNSSHDRRELWLVVFGVIYQISLRVDSP